ncbi:MAG: hypothetical protein WAO22_02200 [bacterium]|jgi:hypothetical protein
MTQENPVPPAALSGGQRLRLKQILNDIIDQLSDQLTQIEQTLTQGMPDLAVGLSSARNMRELEAVLRELLVRQGGERKDVLQEALTAATAMSWQEERSWAQARERALEQGVASLLQAAWLGTALKRQALLTEGLMAAKVLVDSGEGKVSEGYN